MGRLPIPAGLKRYLVPAWNKGHRIGRHLVDYTAACTAWPVRELCGLRQGSADAVPQADHSLQASGIVGMYPRSWPRRCAQRIVDRSAIAVPRCGRGGWRR